jgi:F-type H+-transporting ATPase subunit b
LTSLLTQFGDSSSGIGALGIDVKAFVIQLVTFLLAFWVLEHFAFKPIVKIMNERRATIESGVKLGEQMKQEEAKMAAKVEETLRKAREEADSIIAGAQENGRETIREAEEKARMKADNIVKEADQRIAQDTARARKQLEAEVVGLVSDATEAIIGEKVDAKKDAALIERTLKERQAA